MPSWWRSGPDFHGQLDRLIKGLEELDQQKAALREKIRVATEIAIADPQMAIRPERMVLELIVRDIYEHRFKEPAGMRTAESLIEQLDQSRCVSRPTRGGRAATCLERRRRSALGRALQNLAKLMRRLPARPASSIGTSRWSKPRRSAISQRGTTQESLTAEPELQTTSRRKRSPEEQQTLSCSGMEARCIYWTKNRCGQPAPKRR